MRRTMGMADSYRGRYRWRVTGAAARWRARWPTAMEAIVLLDKTYTQSVLGAWATGRSNGALGDHCGPLVLVGILVGCVHE